MTAPATWILSRVFAAPDDGTVPDMEYRPRNRKLAKHAIGKARPFLARRVWVSSLEARAGFIAVFVDAGWPKHVLYSVDTEADARRLAADDLARLTAPAACRWHLCRPFAGRYYTAAPLPSLPSWLP